MIMARSRKPAPKSRGPAPRRLLVDERRTQLVALGVEAFSRRTYDEVSIDDVARAAGISKGLLYHYFPTKRHFYVATVREAAGQMLAMIDPDKSLPPLDRLERGIDTYLDYVDEHRVAYAALLRSGVGADPEVARIVDQTRQEFMRRLVEGLPVDKPTAKVRATLRGFIGFVEAASLDWLEHRDIPRAELRALLIEVVVAAIQRVVPT